ncbi:hypothetical protein [Sessilibacter corallicola]|uniref:Periplasmic heavy metal sensor n=1 Tax=Sessilibacter corallicola TaxID=2904075 RepID=A0ABQ0AD58_9GAMM
MKKAVKIVIASVALFTTATALAMGPKWPMMMHHFDDKVAEQRLEVVDGLALSDEIKDELKTLISSHDEQMQILFTEHREKVGSVRDDFKSEVDGLLSDDEKEEFRQAMRALMKQKFKEARKHRKSRHHEDER